MKQRTDKVISKDIIHLLISFIFIWGRATSFLLLITPVGCVWQVFDFEERQIVPLVGRKNIWAVVCQSLIEFLSLSHRRSNNQGRSPQGWSLSSYEVSCQLLTNDLNQVLFVSFSTERPLPTNGFLSWLGALRWHRQSCCHSQKLPRNQVVVRWKGQDFV